MNHLGTKILKTPRLTLRPFTMEDAKKMYHNWASDPEVTKFLTWPTHGSVEITRLVLADWVSHYGEENYYQWAIVAEDQPIGSISAVRQNETLNEVEIGYCIGKTWWQRGYTSEALAELIRFFFEEVGVNRVTARHDPNNPGSGAVMRKCGMVYEGTQRQADRNNQGICDVSWYAILRREYHAE